MVTNEAPSSLRPQMRCITDGQVELRNRDVALLAGYSHNGDPSPAFRELARLLNEAGLAVSACIAVDCQLSAAVTPPLEGADFLHVRKNDSYDFGTWSSMLKCHPDILQARKVLFINDSVIPVGSENVINLVRRAIAHESDVVTLTDSNYPKYHSQSYFFCMSGGLLADSRVQSSLFDLPSGLNKIEIIERMELGLLGRLNDLAPYSSHVLFGLDHLFSRSADIENLKLNPTHALWERLILKGFPFLKAELVHINPMRIPIDYWPHVVQEAGGDPKFILEHIVFLQMRRNAHRIKPFHAAFRMAFGDTALQNVRVWNHARLQRRRSRIGKNDKELI